MAESIRLSGTKTHVTTDKVAWIQICSDVEYFSLYQHSQWLIVEYTTTDSNATVSPTLLKPFFILLCSWVKHYSCYLCIIIYCICLFISSHMTFRRSREETGVVWFLNTVLTTPQVFNFNHSLISKFTNIVTHIPSHLIAVFVLAINITNNSKIIESCRDYSLNIDNSL